MPAAERRPRTIEIVRIVGFGLLAIATLVAAGCGFGGPEHSDPSVFSWSGGLKAPGDVRIRNMNGTIVVKPSDDDNVRVTAAARWHRGNPKTDLKFQVASMGSSVSVCVLWSAGSCSDAQGSARAITRGLLSQIFRKRGTDAQVTLTVFVPTRIRVSAVTMNGDVNVTATGPVNARTMNGSIRVATAIGPVDAETVNGNVDARMTTIGDAGPVRAVTVNGTASAYLPDKFDGVVSLSTVNGQIGTDVAIPGSTATKATKSLNGTVGAGGRAVTIEATNGSAWLRHLNADGTVGTADTAKPQ